MLSEHTALLEALLFASGEPAEVSRLSAAAGMDEEQIHDAAQELAEHYKVSGSALTVLRLGDQYQLAATDGYSENIRTLLDKKKNAPLSNAAMEVLAVIAYNQPVTKAFAEQVRGVDCSGAGWICPAGLWFTVRPCIFYAVSACRICPNCLIFPKPEKQTP